MRLPCSPAMSLLLSNTPTQVDRFDGIKVPVKLTLKSRKDFMEGGISFFHHIRESRRNENSDSSWFGRI